MTLKRRITARRAELTAYEYAILTDAELPADDELAEFFIDEAKLWRQHGDAVLLRWVRNHPGTRPRLWWRHAAPAPRLRLGGIGDPWPPWPGAWRWLELGIPVDWIQSNDVEFYKWFYSRDIDGEAAG